MFWFWNKFKFFSSIDDFLLNDWLVKYFSLRCVEILNDNFFWILDWIGFFRIFKFLCILLLNINNLLLNISYWLNVFFSISYLSWNFNWNFVHYFFIVNNRLILNSFCENWSSDFLYSNNWCLHDSLLNNGLGNDSFGNYWLTNNTSLNWRLAYNLLTLSNLRSWIENFVS